MKEIKDLSFSQENQFVKKLLKEIDIYKNENNKKEVAVKASIEDEVEIRKNIAIHNELDYHGLNIVFLKEVSKGSILLI